jgi:signal transduction histidine kinase
VVTVDAVPWVAVGSLAAGVALFGLAGYLLRHRGKPGVNWFVASLSMQGLWCLSYGVALFVSNPTVRSLLEVVSWIGLSWVGFLFLGFALDYTGYSDLRRSWLYPALGSVPLVTTGLLLTTPLHTLIWRDATPVSVLNVVVLEYTLQIGGYAALVIGMAYAGAGVLLLADTILSYGPLYRKEAFAVGISTLPPTIGLVVWMLDLGAATALNWGVVLSLPHALLDAYAFIGTNMFETSPTTRRVADRHAIDSFPDPVLILDSEELLVDFNDQARESFHRVSGSERGRPITEVLAADTTYTDETTDGHLSVTRDQERSQFRVRSTSLVDPRGDVVGYSVVFQDITHEREREERLEVLNRVLRHNMRNKLNVINGSASRLRSELDAPELVDIADRIASSGEALLATSEKAREFDNLRQKEPSFRRVDIVDVVTDVVEGITEEYPSASVHTEMAAEPDLFTDRLVLRLALRNALENAVEHTEDGSPSVTVRVEDASEPGRAVSIAIVDDGPGIPAHEMEVVSQGPETDMDHGSGIGLWILKWSLDRLGGTVEFERGDVGTTVRLHLPTDPTTVR